MTVASSFCSNLTASFGGSSGKASITTIYGGSSVGFMEIACQSGLLQKLSRLLQPFLRFLFPSLKNETRAMEYISTNVIANVLGLGWACTPAGLKAMEELANLEVERGNPEYLQDEKAAMQSASVMSFRTVVR